VRYTFLVSSKKNRRWAYGIFAVAAAYLASFYVIPGFLASSDGRDASGHCVGHQKVTLDQGEHRGRPWHITAGVEKNPGCSFWLLKVAFFPQRQIRGSWTEGWGIAAGGHLPATATIDAHDYEEQGGRVIGGIVGSRARSVVLKLSGGRTVVLYPSDPSDDLRRRFVWLHKLRYFFYFYPSGEHVRTAKLLDANGKVIYTAHSREGELQGNMVY